MIRCHENEDHGQPWASTSAGPLPNRPAATVPADVCTVSSSFHDTDILQNLRTTPSIRTGRNLAFVIADLKSPTLPAQSEATERPLHAALVQIDGSTVPLGKAVYGFSGLGRKQIGSFGHPVGESSHSAHYSICSIGFPTGYQRIDFVAIAKLGGRLMRIDRSEGWDGVAQQFMAARSDIGAALVRSWARDKLPRSSSIVDVGCGSGVPITQALIEEGFEVFGVDASPTLIAAFRRRFPNVQSACEAAQDSTLFHRTFDGAVSIGLLFLLSEDDQQRVLYRVGSSLKPGGRFLFSAPRERCQWQDMLTGRHSRSLGEKGYERLLLSSGLCLVGHSVDEGENHYFEATKPPG